MVSRSENIIATGFEFGLMICGRYRLPYSCLILCNCPVAGSFTFVTHTKHPGIVEIQLINWYLIIMSTVLLLQGSENILFLFQDGLKKS